MMDMDSEKLSEWVVKYQNGDGKAFEQIYNMTCRPAKFTALKILNNNEADAEDVLQDCYIKIMDKMASLQNPKVFMSWFNMIVANQAKSYIRKNNPRFYTEEKEPDDINLDDEWEKEFGDFVRAHIESNNTFSETKKRSLNVENPLEDYEKFLPENDVEREELRKTVMAMIDGLSPEKKTVVILFYYSNMTTREISESIGVSENTIKSRLVQAKKDISKAVLAYEKNKGKILGASPTAIIGWVLKNSAVSTSLTPFAASKLAVTGTVAATATVAAGAGIGTKVVAAIVIAGIVAGGGYTSTKIAKQHRAEEQPNKAVVEEYTEEANEIDSHISANNDSLIPMRPAEEYTVAPNKLVDTYIESGTLKYGVEYSLQRYSNRNRDRNDIYTGRPVLNRKNFKASYDDLLPAAKENIKKYNSYIAESVSKINKKRADDNRQAFKLDDVLTEQANVRAEEIAWTERNTAVRPDGTSYTTLFEHNGYSKGSREEIRRVDYSTYDSAISSILKDAKIYGDFEKIGVGVAVNPENEKLVFVVHLYSEESGKANETISDKDKWISTKNDIIDDIQALILNNGKLDEIEKNLKKYPVLKEILEYDFHNDLIFESMEKIIVFISDWLEKQGE